MAEENVLIFREEQRLSLWLRWPLVLLMIVAAGFAVFSLREGLSAQDSPNTASAVVVTILGIGVGIAVTVLLFTAKLETEVRGDGLYVRLFPFHIHYKDFAPRDLEECYAREYRPIREYGGWGIRCGFGKRGGAYNMSGNKGVQLVFKNGKRLLIGSQKPDELAKAIGSITEST
ncbi:MAG: DUF6141 family protein [Planctomycetota bacterium]